MRRIAPGVPAAFLVFAAVSSAAAETVTAAADAQTSSAHPALRFGSLPAMAVRQGPRGSVLAGYLRFDLSGLPSEPAVQSAVLRLWVRSLAAPGTIEVAPVLGPWQEGTIAGGAAVETGAPVAVFAVEERHAAQSVDVDVTSLVRDWMSGALENHGLVLRADGAGVNVSFHTREGFLTSHAPALELVRAADGLAGEVAEPLTPRLPSGSVMFFDLAACPQGWSPLVEARGRTIVGVNPGGTLRGGWPTTPGGLADQSPRIISGPSGVVAHTHTLSVAAENAHTHTVNLAAEASHVHGVDLPTFTIGADGTHTHTTDSVGSAHNHQIPVTNGGGTSNAVDWFNGTALAGSIPTVGTGAHTHGVTNVGSAHTHIVNPPPLPASGPGTSHTHAATAGAGTSHTHGATAGTTGSTSVDVTLPYVQLLVCRKN